ncbi:GNAT family protein [Bacillus carboniphilus]|uniref:GNAT family protein n=1 Tax=Bacillus carboniphilus TaxID=86663 RepID=A0ABY9JV07_9BACI|nr:GNAT family protein [Bacillus carboniphilus]WLR42328.1 GNAT family protein [Bacillus carboniphilus]
MKQQVNVPLSTERLMLREFTREGWIHVHQYASRERVCQYQPWGPNTEEDSKTYVKQVLEDGQQAPKTRFAFAIVFDSVMVGTVELNIRDMTNKIGEVSYIVNPNYWGNGIATDATSLVIAFGFEDLQLHRIFATCDPRNTGSSKVLEKVGMTKEGRIREDLLIRDGWRDSLLYSVLVHEWKSKRRN